MESDENAAAPRPDESFPPTRRITGRFLDPALEAEFDHEEFLLFTKKFTQFSIALSAAVFFAYGLHDAMLLPSVRVLAWTIRYGICIPVSLATLALAHSRHFERFHQPIVVVFGMSLILIVMWIGAIAPPAGYFIYTSYAVMFVTLGPFIARMTVATQIVYTALTIALFVVIERIHTHSPVEIQLSILATLVALGGIGTLAAYQMGNQARRGFLQRRVIRQQFAELSSEKAKGDALLLNILPAKIAARLKAENRPIADGFAEVSVLFCDIVGFTAMSERLSPELVVQRLNEIFSHFDDLADELGLEKIKTIGDAYMVAGGLPTHSKDHASAIAQMALRMQRHMKERRSDDSELLSVRIGIHTGPVVAGVIGKKKFIYDVWGDTVNTASRMESHSVPGTIQVTEETYLRLKEQYLLESRGEIEVKGKGRMTTYFLLGERKD